MLIKLKHTAMKKIIYVSIFLCLAVIAFQCSPEKRSFNKVKSENTINSYEEFLIKYPKTEYRGVIEIWIDSIKFSKVKSKNTTKEYIDFLKDYPESNYLDSVNFYIEKIQFDKCLDKDSIGTYVEFLENYPESSFKDVVVEKIKEKGIILRISLNKLGSLSNFSDNPAHNCYLEYTGLIEPISNETQKKSSYKLYFQNDDYEKYLNDVAQFYGIPGQYLGGQWEYGYYSKGQMMYTTTYDAYGRPTTTTHKPALTISVHVQFVVILANSEYAIVLILSESNITTMKT